MQKLRNLRYVCNKAEAKTSPADVELVNSYMKATLAEKDAVIDILIAERDSLRAQVAKISSLEDANKERIINQLIADHPYCFARLEFADAFKEATSEKQ